MRKALLLVLPLVGSFIVAGAVGVRAEQAEPELVIVKYGKLIVKCPASDARVFVDDVYKGRADTVIENIPVGDRVISCRSESQSAFGTFHIKRDEVLKLEARFDERKLAPVVEKVAPEKIEPEASPKVEAPKPEKTKLEKKKPEKQKAEKPKKVVVEARKAEPKKIEEQKSPVEERRELHLSVFKVFFEDNDSEEVRISHKANPTVVSRYQDKKNRSGAYYRTKRNMLLCDNGPCEQQWSASFVYTDDTGKNDTFGLTWKRTVFNGITPAGTSRQDLLFCLNGSCMTLENAAADDTRQTAETGRYHITWSRSSLVVRRADIMKEVVDAGGAVEAY